jgi:alcohol dehydrogenase class IV
VYSTDAPKGITVATGMDALAHAVEAYTSRKAFHLTDCYALEAIQKIFVNLPKLYYDGSDKTAWAEMAEAAFMAGDAIASGSPANTVRQVTKEDVVCIYKSLWE